MKNKCQDVPQLNRERKTGEFWDSHDFTEFDPDAPDAEFEIISTVPVQLELLAEIEKQANKRGVKVETLVNQWLRQRLDEEAA